MPKFVIERDIAGIGATPPEQMREGAKKSNEVLKELGPKIQWIQSYVTGDKIYCIYIAPSEDMIREHAQRSGFPANRIMEVRTIMDPTTAEG